MTLDILNNGGIEMINAGITVQIIIQKGWLKRFNTNQTNPEMSIDKA